MRIPNYSRVRLLTDKYREQGARQNAIGYVIEVYADGEYEVEFSDANGNTVAQFAVRVNEIEVAEQDLSHITDQAA